VPAPIDTARVVALVDAWARRIAVENPVVTSIERDPEIDRWYVRVRGEEKLVTTVWFTVRERTLHHESYFMPAPEENAAACYEYLLRANQRLYGMAFSIGGEDAVYLTGRFPISVLADAASSGDPAAVAAAEEHLDTILGATYAYSEECFRTAMRIGFASRFNG